jgi:chaperonin GroES
VAKGKKKAQPKKKVVKKVTKKTAPKKAVKKAAPKKSAAKKAIAKKPALKPIPVKVVKKLDLTKVVTPLDDRVLVQLAEAEKRTAGGLYIPNTVSDVSGNLHGFVVSIGRGRRDKKGRLHPMDLSIGDEIVFTEHAGSKIKIQDQDLMIIRESDVLGVVR